jgi:hypothetical protein
MSVYIVACNFFKAVRRPCLRDTSSRDLNIPSIKQIPAYTRPHTYIHMLTCSRYQPLSPSLKTHTCIHTHICTHTCLLARVISYYNDLLNTYMHTHTHTHTYIHTYIHMLTFSRYQPLSPSLKHIHAYIYTHTYIHMLTCSRYQPLSPSLKHIHAYI